MHVTENMKMQTDIAAKLTIGIARRKDAVAKIPMARLVM